MCSIPIPMNICEVKIEDALFLIGRYTYTYVMCIASQLAFFFIFHHYVLNPQLSQYNHILGERQNETEMGISESEKPTCHINLAFPLVLQKENNDKESHSRDSSQLNCPVFSCSIINIFHRNLPHSKRNNKGHWIEILSKPIIFMYLLLLSKLQCRPVMGYTHYNIPTENWQFQNPSGPCLCNKFIFIFSLYDFFLRQ